MTIVLTYLLLPWGTWLLGTGLRRLAILRVLGALAVLVAGLVPLGDPADKPPGQALGFLILGLPVVLLAGLLRRPPPRAAKPASAPAPSVPEIARGTIEESSLRWTAVLPSAPNLLLRYRDAKGDVTDREIRPSAVRGHGVVTTGQANVLVGFCLTRKGVRHFRLDRVVHAADPTTGEIINLPNWLETRMK